MHQFIPSVGARIYRLATIGPWRRVDRQATNRVPQPRYDGRYRRCSWVAVPTAAIYRTAAPPTLLSVVAS